MPHGNPQTRKPRQGVLKRHLPCVRIRLDRELDVAVPHDPHGLPRIHAGPAQVRAERLAQRVKIDDPPALVHGGDAGGSRILLEGVQRFASRRA